jgi:hypothetical protein
VVSRSEGSDPSSIRYVPEKHVSFKEYLSRHDDVNDSNAGIDVHIHVSYKTIVFALVSFSAITHIVDAISNLF